MAIDNFFKNAVDPLFNRAEKQLKDDGGDYLFYNQVIKLLQQKKKYPIDLFLRFHLFALPLKKHFSCLWPIWHSSTLAISSRKFFSFFFFFSPGPFPFYFGSHFILCRPFSSGMFGADRFPKDCQHVAALHARVGQIPSIRAWIEKRPVNPY